MDYERALKVLGLPQRPVRSDVTSAYRKLSLTCHPDRYPGREAQWHAVSDAHTYLVSLDDAARARAADYAASRSSPPHETADTSVSTDPPPFIQQLFDLLRLGGPLPRWDGAVKLALSQIELNFRVSLERTSLQYRDTAAMHRDFVRFCSVDRTLLPVEASNLLSSCKRCGQAQGCVAFKGVPQLCTCRPLRKRGKRPSEDAPFRVKFKSQVTPPERLLYTVYLAGGQLSTASAPCPDFQTSKVHLELDKLCVFHKSHFSITASGTQYCMKHAKRLASLV